MQIFCSSEMKTPLEYCEYISELTQSEFYFKREDLFPLGGGGNKARMIADIITSAEKSEATTIVTAGGPHSNFNRALALISRQRGFNLKIVLYDKNPHLLGGSLNKRICDSLGTEYIHCSPEEVRETISSELERLRKVGQKPYFIYGGGKSSIAFETYSKVILELKTENKISPDLIATTLATGTTFTGLWLGIEKHFQKTNLLGISIARENDVSLPLIQENLENYLNTKLNAKQIQKLKSQILDEFTFGGYGKSNGKLHTFIVETMIQTGLILDEIYVGKALYGLVQFLHQNKQYQNKKVVFLLTGGIFNF